MDVKKGTSSSAGSGPNTCSTSSAAAGSLQLPEGPAIAFRNLKNAKVRMTEISQCWCQFWLYWQGNEICIKIIMQNFPI